MTPMALKSLEHVLLFMTTNISYIHTPAGLAQGLS